MKDKLTNTLLNQLYDNLAHMNNRPAFVYFNGEKFKNDSKPLRRAVEKWQKDHGKSIN